MFLYELALACFARGVQCSVRSDHIEAYWTDEHVFSNHLTGLLEEVQHCATIVFERIRAREMIPNPRLKFETL